jgi:hypothetical protein
LPTLRSFFRRTFHKPVQLSSDMLFFDKQSCIERCEMVGALKLER